MRKKLKLGFLRTVILLGIVICLTMNINVGVASSFQETTVSYDVTTDDVFPTLTDVDVYVELFCSAVFNSSDGMVLPGDSTDYSIVAGPGSGTLNVSYAVDRPLLKKSGSNSVPIDPTWMLGDSPPITVYDDGTIRINVSIHGHLNGQVASTGNGSVTPSNVVWSTWGAATVIVSANASARDGQIILIQTETTYTVYFTVTVELIPFSYVVTQDSQAKEVSGSPSIQYAINVIPEFPTLMAWFTVVWIATLMVVLGARSRRPISCKNFNNARIRRTRRVQGLASQATSQLNHARNPSTKAY